MNIRNFEFKAKVDSIEFYEKKLLALNPVFKGTDHQIDTYFCATNGRLKLREGNIENALIQYNRENTADAKLSTIILYQHEPNVALKNILQAQLGIKAIVDKKRKIYFIDNVKFHFDIVENLGEFIEVEAIDASEKYSLVELKTSNLIEKSYSDLIASI